MTRVKKKCREVVIRWIVFS